jgi:hypothetical protein
MHIEDNSKSLIINHDLGYVAEERQEEDEFHRHHIPRSCRGRGRLLSESMRDLSLALLLITSVLIVSTPCASVSVTKIELNPIELFVSAPGQNFTVDVNVTDVAGLGAWEYKFTYNTTMLDATWVSKTSVTEDCEYWGPVDPDTFQWTPTSGINDSIGGGLGQVWSGASFPWGQELTGNGTLVTINFTATAEGTCSLTFTETVLGDSMGDPIAHTAIPGTVTVIPEFPATLIMPLLAIATLAAAFFGKTFWSKRRKVAPDSK